MLGLIGVIVGLYFVKDIVSFRVVPQWKVVRQNMSLGIQAMMTDVGVVLGAWLTTAVLKMYTNDFSQVGYLSRALVLALVVTLMFESVIQLLYASWSKVEGEVRKISVEKTLNFVFLISIVVSICVFFFSKMLVLLLFGEMFLPAVTATKIIVVGACFLNIVRTLDPLFRSNNKAYLSVIIIGVGLVVNISTAIFLTPLFDADGSATSLLISNVLMAVLALFFASSNYGVSIRRVLIPSPMVIKSVVRQVVRSRGV